MSDQSTNPVSYVREGMLPEQAPPVGETGVIKWVRENLLSSPLNIVLTIISLWVVYSALSGVLPWLFNSVWNAGSLSECREILAAKGMNSHDGGCFAVIQNRWHQLLFGYYPDYLYWRPILALAIFLVGLAPVLFLSLPRALLAVTFTAPFLCFWLLWGGSFWLPLAIIFGFVIGYLILKYLEGVAGTLATTILMIVVPILYWLYAAVPLVEYLSSLNGAFYIAHIVGLALSVAIFSILRQRVEAWQAVLIAIAIFAAWWALISPLLGIRLMLLFGIENPISLSIEQVASRDFGGFMLSTVIGLSAIVLSLPLGILLALSRQSSLPIIKWSAVIFIEVIRGVPLIVWLFTAQLLLNYFLPPGTTFDLTLRVIIMVTLFSSAYIAEVIRGGLAALPKGQYEGADSLGLNYWQSMQLIILPQALKISIPGIVNSFIGLFKDTTLVLFIGLFDPLGIASAIRATTEWNGVYWELFIFIGVMFFIACFSMGRYSLYLERLLQREHR